jgi:hypothetical protein
MMTRIGNSRHVPLKRVCTSSLFHHNFTFHNFTLHKVSETIPTEFQVPFRQNNDNNVTIHFRRCCRPPAPPRPASTVSLPFSALFSPPQPDAVELPTYLPTYLQDRCPNSSSPVSDKLCRTVHHGSLSTLVGNSLGVRLAPKSRTGLAGDVQDTRGPQRGTETCEKTVTGRTGEKCPELESVRTSERMALSSIHATCCFFSIQEEKASPSLDHAYE